MRGTSVPGETEFFRLRDNAIEISRKEANALPHTRTIYANNNNRRPYWTEAERTYWTTVAVGKFVTPHSGVQRNPDDPVAKTIRRLREGLGIAWGDEQVLNAALLCVRASGDIYTRVLTFQTNPIPLVAAIVAFTRPDIPPRHEHDHDTIVPTYALAIQILRHMEPPIDDPSMSDADYGRALIRVMREMTASVYVRLREPHIRNRLKCYAQTLTTDLRDVVTQCQSARQAYVSVTEGMGAYPDVGIPYIALLRTYQSDQSTLLQLNSQEFKQILDFTKPVPCGLGSFDTRTIAPTPRDWQAIILAKTRDGSVPARIVAETTKNRQMTRPTTPAYLQDRHLCYKVGQGSHKHAGIWMLSDPLLADTHNFSLEVAKYIDTYPNTMRVKWVPYRENMKPADGYTCLEAEEVIAAFVVDANGRAQPKLIEIADNAFSAIGHALRSSQVSLQEAINDIRERHERTSKYVTHVPVNHVMNRVWITAKIDDTSPIEMEHDLITQASLRR